MTNISVYIPNVPHHWATYAAIKELFERHELGVVKRINFYGVSDEQGVDAHVHFKHWYTTQWSRYIHKTLTTSNSPAYVALFQIDGSFSDEFLSLHRLYCDDDVDGLKHELTDLRREMGLQCGSCSNTTDLVQDWDEYGESFCPSCWFDWNNAEAIRAKERDIGEMECRIIDLYLSDDPHSAYRAEELLEDIQERRDEIAMLRTSESRPITS